MIRQGTITPARRSKQPIDVAKLPKLPPGPRLSDIVIAVHLASAAVIGSGVIMVSRDTALRDAALAAGLDVAP